MKGGGKMKKETITCPKCGEKIPISEAFVHSVEEKLRKDFERKTKKIQKEAEVKAKEAIDIEIEDLKNQLNEKDKKVKKAEKAELDLRKRERELEDKMESLELETARTIDKERKKIEEKAIEKFAEEQKLRDREKEEQIKGLTKKIDELKRKAEQGSQQLQGEVLELELEDILKESFPNDIIEPVPKGIRGADILQKVHKKGKYCGTIVWETKRTKSWDKSWITKLKRDQTTVKAEVAVLVSRALPEDVNTFSMIKGVFVTSYNSSLPLAAILRNNLYEIFNTKQANVGKNNKIELLYNYISSPEFRQKVEVMGDAMVTMKEDLDKERRAITKSWAKRDKQIMQTVLCLADIYGDLQGIIGASLPEIEKLALPSGSDDE